MLKSLVERTATSVILKHLKQYLTLTVVSNTTAVESAASAIRFHHLPVNSNRLLSAVCMDSIEQSACSPPAPPSPKETELLKSINIEELYKETQSQSSEVDGGSAAVKSKGSRRKEKKKKDRHESTGDELPAAKHQRRVSPNYFVAIQITNAQIHSKIEEIQAHVVEQKAELKSAVIAPPTLHITLMVMHLDRKELPLDSVKKAMDMCADEVRSRSLLPLTLTLEGVSSFHDTVVFTKIQPGDALDKLSSLAGLVDKSFTSCGIPSTESRSFTPHITMFKMSRDFKLRGKGIKKIDSGLYDKYKGMLMGDQEVTTLQLCSMSDPKDDKGYYPVLHQVNLSGNNSDVETTSSSENNQ